MTNIPRNEQNRIVVPLRVTILNSLDFRLRGNDNLMIYLN